MALREHQKEDILLIRSRFIAIADSLQTLIDDMEKAGCESVEFQSESVLNHKLAPIEDWVYRVRGLAEKRLRKLRLRKDAEEIGRKYAAEKDRKPAKSPEKRKK